MIRVNALQHGLCPEGDRWSVSA